MDQRQSCRACSAPSHCPGPSRELIGGTCSLRSPNGHRTSVVGRRWLGGSTRRRPQDSSHCLGCRHDRDGKILIFCSTMIFQVGQELLHYFRADFYDYQRTRKLLTTNSQRAALVSRRKQIHVQPDRSGYASRQLSKECIAVVDVHAFAVVRHEQSAFLRSFSRIVRRKQGDEVAVPR